MLICGWDEGTVVSWRKQSQNDKVGEVVGEKFDLTSSSSIV